MPNTENRRPTDNFVPTDSLIPPVRFGRRMLFVGGGLSATAMFLSACGLDADPNCGDNNCYDNPPLEVPEPFRQRIDSLTQPIKRLMKPPFNTFKTNFLKTTGDNDGKVGGKTVANTTDPQIYIFMPNLAPETQHRAEVTATHETKHIFDSANGGLPSKDTGLETHTRLNSNRKFTDDELAILGENTYIENIGDQPSNMAELFASTSTVLQLFPNEFMAKISTLPDESRQVLATYALACIDTFKKYSVIPVEYADLPFSPTLISFLQKHGISAK